MTDKNKATAIKVLLFGWVALKVKASCVVFFSGGVMLVHNIRKNETRVIDFRETAPASIHEEMLTFNMDQKVRDSMMGKKMVVPWAVFNIHSCWFKPGLWVGVPGMLSGMHQAHQLYGRYD